MAKKQQEAVEATVTDEVEETVTEVEVDTAEEFNEHQLRIIAAQRAITGL